MFLCLAYQWWRIFFPCGKNSHLVVISYVLNCVSYLFFFLFLKGYFSIFLLCIFKLVLFILQLHCWKRDTVKKQLSRKILVQVPVILQDCVNENSYVSEWKNGHSWRTSIDILRTAGRFVWCSNQFTHSLYLSLLCKVKHFS